MLKGITSTTKMLNNPVILELGEQFPQRLVMQTIKDVSQELRDRILATTESRLPDIDISADNIASMVGERVKSECLPGVRPAINATGIILHTGLGRAPLARSAQLALARAVRNYCTLEIDIPTGKRGNRHQHVEWLLCQLTGAEAACVVNNNAAAVLLALNTLADNRRVLISRGQLVEIGGAFRMPDVMRLSGAEMVEVGTTNRTHLRDYQEALDRNTAMIQTVHPSNYHIEGFTNEVSLTDLKTLAHSRVLPIVHDIGSGCLLDFTSRGLPPEPVVARSIRDGADIVTFSGDKLLGGPQSGIAVGKKELVDRMKANPLCRALRCDKMTYPVLEATLKLFLDEKSLVEELPALRMAAATAEEIGERARQFIELMGTKIGASCKLQIIDGTSEMGSGSMPGHSIPSRLVAISCNGLSADELAHRLRLSEPPVFGRIADGRYLLDLRTVLHEELEILVNLVMAALSKAN